MKLRRCLSLFTLGLGLLAVTSAIACTSLGYIDAKGKFYVGRTMELTAMLPWQLVYLPRGQKFESAAGEGHPPLRYESRYAVVAITMPDVAPGEKPALPDLKVIDGQNEAGLTYSVLAYPSAEGPQKQYDMTRALLNVVDLGTWVLGQYATIAEVKAALSEQPLVLAPVKVLRGAEPPLHFVLYDRTGASLVIEFQDGKETLYDNPVGVLTNGPQFSWQLVNLNNYAQLTNIDRSSGQFGGLKVQQPDSGIATAGLPASDTSVGRFVRAAYYSTFAEKVDDPDSAVKTLAHVMNNFDRPKDISISMSGEGDALAEGLGLGTGKSTEFTLWTKLADLERGVYYVRSYDAVNYTSFDIGKLAEHATPLVLPLAAFDGMATDGTSALLDAKLP